MGLLILLQYPNRICKILVSKLESLYFIFCPVTFEPSVLTHNVDLSSLQFQS